MLSENSKEELQKKHIADLFPHAKKHLCNFPSLSQCIGTKRLWSWRLGKSFSYDLEDEKKSIHLERIAYLSRTYLVIHDFLKDEFVSDSCKLMGINWLSNIEDVIRNEISSLGGKPDEFSKQLQICEKGYIENEKINILEKAINKCHIFFNPYNLFSLSLNKELQNKRVEFLKDFFITCQLLDDYCDIESDVTKKRNHNLFMANLSESEIGDLIKIKKLIAPSLLRSLDTYLSTYSELKEEKNLIINYYFDYAVKWLREKCKSFSFDGEYEFLEFNCSLWNFTSSDLAYFVDLSKQVKIYGRLEDIRPEFLQANFDLSELD